MIQRYLVFAKCKCQNSKEPSVFIIFNLKRLVRAGIFFCKLLGRIIFLLPLHSD